MALAYLCSKIRRTDEWFRVADHPVSSPFGIIVNHDLREGSAVEADNVAAAIRKFGVKSHVLKIIWKDVIPEGVNPNDLPNVETLARYLRYRRLGTFCKIGKMTTLLTAHHEDDQYETVMMRLLSGHGYRGLQGMRPATDIPECYDLHGVYQSGFIDDQRRDNPIYRIVPGDRERKVLKRGLRNEVDPVIIAREIEAGLKADIATAYLDEYDDMAKGNKRAPRPVPLEIEDGGIMVYRPLLGFSKDRLIATCLENNIPWFEDHTNADRTLTMRNAVRYMHKNHKLPAALQKPSILRLAERCRARIASAEAEAARFLDRVVIHEFWPNTGTLVVTLPRFSLPRVPRLSSASLAAQERRTAHYRHVAALLIRRLISMVTPERELSQPSQLSHLVSMLFPSLSSPPPPAKPYVICSVHFTPLPLPGNPDNASTKKSTEEKDRDQPRRWLLTRAPHPSNAPRPAVTFHDLAFGKRRGKPPGAWKTAGWSGTRFFDGRYWIRLLHRLPCRLRVAPLEPEHLRPFRDALDSSASAAGSTAGVGGGEVEPGKERRRKKKKEELMAMLARYAPGKTRWTLPAIYATVDVSKLLEKEEWWPQGYHHQGDDGGVAENRNNADGSGSGVGWVGGEEDVEERELVDRIRSHQLSGAHLSRWEWERELKSREKLHLLALPTLGVGLPGLEGWLRWEVRYKKVDEELLRLSKLGGRRIERRELRHRVRCLYRWMRLGRAREASRRRRTAE
ncbi:hypothetical protein C7999DRAFT_10567 [Corynascus novoguineensis]|uniref:tRNA(Ile)-lysidine synthetase n=1 Tax=Corynascus novoguineensis TaxID=1126955 RepID=A0AAN7D195_9PEZI|nr:hypothetical protein C7999DRAFT_10567 [Corynascus novoguineensis]